MRVSFKHVVVVVMQVWGLIFMMASLVIVGGELYQMIEALRTTAKHDWHWEPWGGAIGVGSFGALLWQTGKITAALEIWVPYIIEFIKNMKPGGRRSTDPPGDMELPPPPAKHDHVGEEGP